MRSILASLMKWEEKNVTTFVRKFVYKLFVLRTNLFVEIWNRNIAVFHHTLDMLILTCQPQRYTFLYMDRFYRVLRDDNVQFMNNMVRKC